ncbi:MAG TPA: hypothetical protein VGL02_15795, partial [Streptomyces sp.]
MRTTLAGRAVFANSRRGMTGAPVPLTAGQGVLAAGSRGKSFGSAGGGGHDAVMGRSDDELVAEADSVSVDGWDFSWLEGRAT